MAARRALYSRRGAAREVHRRIHALEHRAADLPERDAIAIVSWGIELVSGRLRFLHVTTFYPPHNFGGDGIFVGHLARALAEAGHLVDVIHCVDSYKLLSDGQPGDPMPGHPSLNVFGLRSGFGWLSPLLSHQLGGPFLKRRAIGEFLRGRHYDVVHYHNISLFGPKILSWMPPAGASLKLYTMHEHWLVRPMHVLWKFDQRPCERPQCIRCELRAGRPPQLWRYFGLLERAARDIDLFLAPSRFTGDSLEVSAVGHRDRAHGALPVMREVKVEAKRRGVELVIVPTDRALDCFTRGGDDTKQSLHVTC